MLTKIVKNNIKILNKLENQLKNLTKTPPIQNPRPKPPLTTKNPQLKATPSLSQQFSHQQYLNQQNEFLLQPIQTQPR